MEKGRGGLVIDSIWKFYIVFESDVVPEDWRFVVIITLYKGKRERNECRNYSVISLFSVV